MVELVGQQLVDTFIWRSAGAGNGQYDAHRDHLAVMLDKSTTSGLRNRAETLSRPELRDASRSTPTFQASVGTEEDDPPLSPRMPAADIVASSGPTRSSPRDAIDGRWLYLSVAGCVALSLFLGGLLL
jgi:hypothetical protein